MIARLDSFTRSCHFLGNWGNFLLWQLSVMY